MVVLSLALGKSSLHHIQGEGLPADLNSTSRRLWVANVVEFDSGTKGVCFNRCEDRECIICCTCSVDLGNRVTSDMLAHSLKMFLWGIRTKTSMQTRALLSLSLSLSLVTISEFSITIVYCLSSVLYRFKSTVSPNQTLSFSTEQTSSWPPDSPLSPLPKTPPFSSPGSTTLKNFPYFAPP